MLLCPPPDTLVTALSSKKVVPVIGAGVSKAAAGYPNWTCLIQSGLDFVEKNGGADASELLAANVILKSGHLIEAAQALKKLLRAPGGQYAAWLESEFLETPSTIVDPRLIDRIVDLLCPILCTTNYDMLLERLHVSHHEAITWRQPTDMLRALQHGQAVFHLHGVYTDPESVVLGNDNYEDLVKDEAYRSILQALWLERTLLFIGCSSSGLEDPDFLRMLRWFSSAFPRTAHRHFALMLAGTCSPEDKAKWLHDFRIQIVEYGPNYSDLAGAINQLAPDPAEARALRMRRIKAIAEGGDRKDIEPLVALLKSAGASAAPEDLLSTAQKLFQATKKEREGQRQNFIAMQMLARSMVSPEEMQAQLHLWTTNQARYEGEFRLVVQRAADALFLFPKPLLTILYQRDVAVHHAVLHGMCRSEYQMAEVMLSNFGRHDDDKYFLENMARILRSVQNILNADPSKIFPEVRKAVLVGKMPDIALIVARSRRVEVRRGDSATEIVASLPMDEDVSCAMVSRLDEKEVVLVHTASSVSAWDPALAAPHKTYTVESRWRRGVTCHLQDGCTLRSLVAVHEGGVIKLSNLDESDYLLPGTGPFSSLAFLPDGRAFGIVSRQLPVLELFQGHTEVSLSAAELADQISQSPILGTLWKKRNDEGGLAKLSQELQFSMNFQHVRLKSVRWGAGAMLALSIRLSFFHAYDQVILFLAPDGNKLRVAGHCVMESRIMVGFDVGIGAMGELWTLCPLLSSGAQDFDLAVWSRGAQTASGLIFVPQGSVLQSKRDLLCAAFGTEEKSYVSDDDGGLFEIDINQKTYQEVDRDSASDIRSLNYHKVN